MVSILILNYNGKIFLKDCIKSVLSQSYKDFEIIFCDNASTDGSLDFIQKEFTDNRLKSYSSKINIGFSGGNNYAFKKSTGNLIVLLNNDTIVRENWLAELVSTINLSDEVGMVQSLVYTKGIPNKYYLKNGTINLSGHNIMEVFSINNNGTGEIFQANGCSLIVKRKIIDQSGNLFPEEYFAYAEDTYLSFKVKFMGYKILHNSNSIVDHLGGSTMKYFKNSFVTFYQERNRILNILIYFSLKFRIKYYPLLLQNCFLKIIYSVFTNRYSLRGILKAYFWILLNQRWIKKEREMANKIKVKSDDEILGFLSGKFANGDNFFERALNRVNLIYLKIVNVKTIELI